MHIALMDIAAIVGIFVLVIWMGRKAIALADAASNLHMKRTVYRASDRWAPQGTPIGDRRSLIRADAVDAEYEEVKR